MAAQWQCRGTLKRQRLHTQIAAVAIAQAVVERHDVEGPDYDCGERCDMCVPDWRDRDELRKRIVREAPPFTLADRLLAQVGILIRLAA